MIETRQSDNSGGTGGPRSIILVVYEDYARDSRVRRHARAFAQAGFHVEVLALGGAEAARAAGSDGVQLQCLGVAKYRGASRVRYVRAYTRFMMQLVVRMLGTLRRPVSAVWINNPPDMLAFAAFPARLRGIPIVVDVHDMTSHLFAAKFGGGGLMGRIVRGVETLSWRFATGIVTVHDRYRDQIAVRVPSKPVVAVLNVPDSAEWVAIGDKRAANHLDTQSGVLVLGHHGTIVERFGIDLAVRAVALLRSEGVLVRLRILGDGDFAPRIQNLIDELRLRDCVDFDRRTFLPDEVASFAASIDVGLAPYRESPFIDHALPVKVLEYIILGLPVISTPTSVMREYISATAVCYLNPPTANGLADAIKAMMEPGQRAAYQSAGRHVARRLNWPQQRELLFRWLNDLLHAQGA